MVSMLSTIDSYICGNHMLNQPISISCFISLGNYSVERHARLTFRLNRVNQPPRSVGCIFWKSYTWAGILQWMSPIQIHWNTHMLSNMWLLHSQRVFLCIFKTHIHIHTKNMIRRCSWNEECEIHHCRIHCSGKQSLSHCVCKDRRAWVYMCLKICSCE